MAKNRKRKSKNNRGNFAKKWESKHWLPEGSKKHIAGVVMVLVAVIVALSFFERSGMAGHWLRSGLLFLVGQTVFAFPLLLLFSGLISLRPRYKNFFYSLLLGNLLFILGIAGILESLNQGELSGGWLGYLVASPLLRLFDFLATQIIFLAVVVIGFLVFWHLLGVGQLWQAKQRQEQELSEVKISTTDTEKESSFVSRVLRKMVSGSPSFKVKEVPSDMEKPTRERLGTEKPPQPELKTKPIQSSILSYTPPPKELLEKDGGKAGPGDIRLNASIIKKTLQNFDIPVEMSEVSVGPTVTQYTLKPAEGVKLSRITALSSDLSLALASHPIRIEAPIPGRSLVGIEVPNKTRARVGLREMIDSQEFQSLPHLNIVLGKDVSGIPVFADLAKMPHLLVAGSTGSGKTIFLNNLILSLLYKNSPENLRFILIDPKRVEFPVYEGLPHLLSPVIFDASQTVNSLKWLIGEMERRFDVLSESKARDIASYNRIFAGNQDLEALPYIILIIDELADLMAAKGREVEVGIVRLAQMARAVGIHLVVATQRPSVEVITGLIKANITCRITFQVASQVDSRTVLDSSGAEKLLGLGDLLYLSPETGKPKRIQSAFVSEKEIKKVVNYLQKETTGHETQNHLSQDLKKTIEAPQGLDFDEGASQDPLYEEAKKEIILARKASASLLQRRLSIGYARAARLIDMLEERGVVGPGEGAKPREVYLEGEGENDEWQKV